MTARFPKLSEPDTKGEYADNKYKTEAIADESYTEAFMEEIRKVADEHFAGKKNVHVPWKETKDFKSPKKKPQLKDSKGNFQAGDSPMMAADLYGARES
jgi:DNA-directed RNA polymerase